VGKFAFEACHGLPKNLNGWGVVAKMLVGPTYDKAGYGLQPPIPEIVANLEAALRSLDGPGMLPGLRELPGQIGGYPPQTAAVVQDGGDLFGLAEALEDPMRSGPNERVAHVEPEVDGLLEPLAALRKMSQSHKRLLEARRCFLVG